ncbi:MAG: LamG domain-containing protein, partial [Candidatus Shapirobacteria bacterium]|nr:LamG domain-containing protein [Candidatus Shapirobacteria bacterium]
VITGVNLSTWTSLRVSNYPNFQYNGYLDELRLYNRTLSPGEVSTLYNFAPGPVGYWDFNDGSGTIAQDKSGNGLNGTVTGNPVWKSGGNCKIGGCLTLDHVDDRVTVNHSSLLEPQSITIEGWVKLNSTGDRQVLFTKWNGYSLEINSSGYPYLRLNGSSPQDLYSSKAITWGKWHHVATTLDSNTKLKTVYLDGINVGSTVTTGSIIYNQGVLAFPYSTATYGNGLIDEFKIYNYARTGKQIIEDMTAGASAVSSKSMIAYYKFDEGYGTTTSNWGNGSTTLNGTLTGTTIPTWTNDSKSGKAINLNGINSFARTGIIPASDAFSLSVWFKANQVRDQNRIYWGTGTDKAILAFSGTSGYLTWYMSTSGGNTGYKNTSKKININDWNHVVLVYNGSIVKCFINGVEDGITSTLTGTSVASAINLGTNYNNTGNWFDGKIDEVKAYNYALTAEEIKQDYNQGSSISFGSTTQNIGGTTTSLDYCIPGDTSYCASPVAEWKMDEGTGTSIVDTSGNNNTGTISGATWDQGKIGKGLKFNGSDNYVEVSSTPSTTGSFTISTWVKAINGSTSDGYGYIIHRSNLYSIGDSVYFLGINPTGNYVGAVNGNFSNGDTGIPANENIWRFLTLSYDGNTQRVYVDGQLKSTYSFGAITRVTANNKIGFGGTPLYLNYRNIKGQMDQVRIYDYTRTPAQIAYDYNKGGPVGWWKFDECQGNIAYDWSGIGNTGVINIGSSGTQNSLGTCAIGTSAAWTNGTSGKVNSSLNFDGTDDKIVLSGTSSSLPSGSSPRSISLFFKYQNLPNTYNTIVGYGTASTSNANGLIMQNNNKLLYFGYGNDLISNATLSSNTWYHIVGTYDNNSIARLYINGKLDNSGSHTWNTILNKFYIGEQINESSEYFSGQIDDVRIYNYALTVEQIKQIYNGGSVNFR